MRLRSTKTTRLPQRASLPPAKRIRTAAAAPDTYGARPPKLDQGQRHTGASAVPAIGRPRARAGALAHVGVISDLDQTIIPTHDGRCIPAPYGGIVEILAAIRAKQGKVFYVTARSPETAKPIPAYLAQHQLPKGRLDIGPGGGRAASIEGKLDDIRGIFERHPSRSFVLFGDSSHVDAEVYRTIAAQYPGRVIATFIHDVKPIEPERVQDMHVISSYADAAQVLEGLGILDKPSAKRAAQAAHDRCA